MKKMQTKIEQIKYQNTWRVRKFRLVKERKSLLFPNNLAFQKFYASEMQVSNRLRRTWSTVVKWEKDAKIPPEQL